MHNACYYNRSNKRGQHSCVGIHYGIKSRPLSLTYADGIILRSDWRGTSSKFAFGPLAANVASIFSWIGISCAYAERITSAPYPNA